MLERLSFEHSLEHFCRPVVLTAAAAQDCSSPNDSVCVKVEIRDIVAASVLQADVMVDLKIFSQ